MPKRNQEKNKKIVIGPDIIYTQEYIRLWNPPKILKDSNK